MADDAVSTRSTFDWDAVPLDLLRALAASAASRDEKAHVAAASPEQLIDAASRSFGQRGATSRDARAGALVLREQWLPTATPESVHAIYGQLSHPRTAATPADQQAFLAIRKLNEGYRTLLWHHFRAEHRHARPAARARTSNVRSDPRGFFDLQGAGADPRELWPHQVAVHRALDERTFGRKAPGALVVLPTGAGKTRTAVTWLLRLLVESPESRVVWVAHQVELVEQAERAFIESAQECPIGWSARVRVIATNRGGGSTIGRGDAQIVVATWQSLAAGHSRARADAVRAVLGDHGVLVIDEAHHAGAGGYQEILKAVSGPTGPRLLGLTATPWPSAPTARDNLRTYFPKPDIAPVDAVTLIASGLLAQPVLHLVQTNFTVQPTERDLKSDAADLLPPLLRMLESEDRDQVVVRTWSEPTAEWGKTLVYATSIAHADGLTRRFQAAGHPARSLHSRTRDRAATLGWFRDEQASCVLVSVGMLNEGVDLPHARTAFLARPTRSRILLRQMVGRVLRGPEAGGDPVAHLVSFRDEGLAVLDVLGPEDLRDLETALDRSDDGKRVASSLPLIRDAKRDVTIPAEVVAALQRLLAGRTSPWEPANPMELIGYYDLGGETGAVPVLDQHASAYAGLIVDLVRNPGSASRPRTYFAESPTPWPSDHVLRMLREYVRDAGTAPELVRLETSSDPRRLARVLLSGAGQTEVERQDLIRSTYESSLASLNYPSLRRFAAAVNDALADLVSSAAGRPPLDPEVAVIDELPRNTRKPPRMRRVPGTKMLLSETRRLLGDQADLLQLMASSEPVPEIRWSERPVQSWWARYDPGVRRPPVLRDPTIQLNRRLRDVDLVSDPAVQYLAYHELLHHLLAGEGHSARFRELESRGHDSLGLDTELDTIHERIGGLRARRR